MSYNYKDITTVLQAAEVLDAPTSLPGVPPYIEALYQLTLVTRVINGADYDPDATPGILDEKWFPVFDKEDDTITFNCPYSAFGYVDMAGSVLFCLRDEARTRHMAEHFMDLYTQVICRS